MKNFKIVKACGDYIDNIVVIENLSFKIPWSRESITEEIVRNKIAVYFCAVIDGMAVGYAGMWHILDEGHITNIAVHPEFRNNGIGDALMKVLLEAAISHGIKALTLEVKRSNHVAQTLYSKHGFREEGIRKAYYADNNEDAIIMWKRFGRESDL